MRKPFPLNRSNLSQQVADHLEEYILSSTGDNIHQKLPSEQQLADSYSVSRPVIREAFKMLQERGLITLRNGKGAYVSRPESGDVEAVVGRFMQLHDISDRELTDMRAVIESYAARKAAENASEKDIAELGKNVERFRDRNLSMKERVALDAQFHVLIAQASGNRLLKLFNEVLVSMLSDYMGKGVLLPGGIDDAITRHCKLYEAIAAHDIDATDIAIREHLKASEENVILYKEQFGDL